MPSEREKMLRGGLYDASDPQLVAERQRARELTREYDRTTGNDPSGTTDLGGTVRLHRGRRLRRTLVSL